MSLNVDAPNEQNILAFAQALIAQCLVGIHDFTHKGHCSRCGECCSNLLPLSESEIYRISAYIKEHNIKPAPLFKHHRIYSGSCPFLDEHKICSIYEVRPLICKAFKCNRKSPNKTYTKLLLLEKRENFNVRDTFFFQAVRVMHPDGDFEKEGNISSHG